ncbi:MAG: hypothetical protein HY826_08065 [Actinobacteria bacterium]|nr:hypothetical protein [Actinomycetota bacterium]
MTEGASRRWLLGIFAVTFATYAISPVRQNYDSYLAFPTAQSIVHDGNLTINEFDSPAFEGHGWTSITDSGDRVNTYPWVPSLMLLPAVVALDAFHAIGIGPGSFSVANGGSMDVIQQLSASMVVALTVALVFAICFQRLRPTLTLRRRRRVAALVAFGFAFGTAAWSTASRAMWQHGPSLLYLAVAVYCAQQLRLRARHADLVLTLPGLNYQALGLGAAVAASYTCRPTDAVAVVGFSVFVIFRLRNHLWRYLAGALAVAIPWLLVNLATYGAALPDYYRAGKVGVHDNYLRALATNMVSPARGLLLFSPIVVLGAVGLAKRTRGGISADLFDFDRLLIAMCLGYLLVSSGPAENWWAGHSFGPRFMSDTLVFLAVVATGTVDALVSREKSDQAQAGRSVRIAATIALAWSLLVNVQGATMRSTLCWNGDPDIDTHTSRLWDFRYSQMLSGLQAVADDGVADAFFTRCDTEVD